MAKKNEPGSKSGVAGKNKGTKSAARGTGRVRELTEKQNEFTRCYFRCKNGTQAYRESYGKGKDLKDTTCTVEASKLLRNPKVQEYLEELNRKAEDEAVLSRKRRMMWLSRVVTTAVNDVDGESDLCQEVVTSEFGSKCRMPDKLKAIQELNRMDGSYEEWKVKVKVEGELSFSSLLKSLKRENLVVPPKKEGEDDKG